jgi:cell division protease FtsH
MRIDSAIKAILEAALNRVTAILTEHRDQLEKLAEALVARETLEDSEVRELLGFPPREARA